MNQSILEEIKGKILPRLEQAQITKAALFGSYVRGDNDENSDIDILVEYPQGRSGLAFIGLQQDLEEILQKKVDLVSYRWIHPLLRDSILRWQYPILPASDENAIPPAEISNSPQPATGGKKMKKDPLIHLTRILESIKQLETYLQGITYEYFLESVEKQDAVALRLEQIGENTKKLPMELRENHPEVPWKMMAGLRDRIAQTRDGINFDIIWSIVTDELLPLKQQMEQLVQEYSSPSPGAII